jgi:hypothetical protein
MVEFRRISSILDTKRSLFDPKSSQIAPKRAPIIFAISVALSKVQANSGPLP